MAQENGGPREVLRSADVSTYAAAAIKAGRRRSSSRRPMGRVQPMLRLVEGRTFILHVIVGKGIVDRRRR